MRAFVRQTLARQRGFTIIELLIVIVIVSILAAIAVPSYRTYVMRTNRTVAKVALQELLTRQESYAVDHKSYARTFSGLGLSGSGAADTGYVTRDGLLSLNSTDALYRFALNDAVKSGSSMSASCADLGTTNTTPTGIRSGYQISATPVTATTDTACATLCLSSAGERGASAGTVADCWRR